MNENERELKWLRRVRDLCGLLAAETEIDRLLPLILDSAVAPGGTLPDAERSLVEAALRAAGGNKARAARQLGIERTKLYRLLERYGLS